MYKKELKTVESGKMFDVVQNSNFSNQSIQKKKNICNSFEKLNISNSSFTTKSYISRPSLSEVPLVKGKFQNTNILFKPQNSNTDSSPVFAAIRIQNTDFEECVFQPELPFKTTKIESFHVIPKNKVEIDNLQISANLTIDSKVLMYSKVLPDVAHQLKN